MTPPGRPLLLSCSPRSGGNSDAAITALRRIVWGSLPGGGGPAQEPCAPPIVFLRDHPVSPCVSCGHCARHKLACPLAAHDASAPLLGALQTASTLLLVAPVYFYHIPAQLKALIDRGQPWWMLHSVWKETPFPRRTAHAVLLAARPQGKKLFEGSILSLRYWLGLFGYDLAPPLTLYGLDGPNALRDDTERYGQLVRHAESLRAALLRAGE